MLFVFRDLLLVVRSTFSVWTEKYIFGSNCFIINTQNSNIMKISTRNVLKGTIIHIEHGAVNSEVTIQLPGGQKIVSIITKTSAQNLELKKGMEVYGLIKASNVMIAID